MLFHLMLIFLLLIYFAPAFLRFPVAIQLILRQILCHSPYYVAFLLFFIYILFTPHADSYSYILHNFPC